MITEMQLADILQFSLVALSWLFLVFKILPYVRLDGFRQNMFAIRDELFDYAADGNISFDQPAYVMLRRQMNGFIRYGHQLTVFRCLTTVAIHKVSGRPTNTEWYSEWQTALASVEDAQVREKLEYFHKKGMMLAVKRLLFGSPLLWIVTLIFSVQMVFQGAAKGFVQLLKMASKKTFTGPINDRLIEEAAQGEFA